LPPKLPSPRKKLPAKKPTKVKSTGARKGAKGKKKAQVGMIKRFRNWVIKQFLKVFLLFALVIGGVLGGFELFKNYALPEDPGEVYTLKYVQKVLSSDTEILYRDKKTLLGVPPGDVHRSFIPIEKIPQKLVFAVVATEDSDFYTHSGINWTGLVRAIYVDFRERRMAQGGSSISQQTAKNFFGRPSKSIKGKALELYHTLRLEKHFSKKQIIEIYLNQFHVAGNSRGVGAAARWYFDRDLQDLNLKELAFIAAALKGPSLYDPFRQKTPEAAQRSKERREGRIKHVLQRMQDEGYLEPTLRKAALKKKLRFRFGGTGSNSRTSLAAIIRELDDPVWQRVLGGAGVEDWASGKLKIVSTLDAKLQNKALSELQLGLTSVGLSTGWAGSSEEKGSSKGFWKLGKKYEFNINRIQKNAEGWPSLVEVKYEGRHFKFDLPRPIRGALSKSKWMKSLKVGSSVVGNLVEISNKKGDNPIFQLHTGAGVEGALVLLRKGQVLVSIGGFKDMHFDRARMAKRSMGSFWKLPAYALALKYGWELNDLFYNEERAIKWNNKFWFPRNSHSGSAAVTMMWAGVQSDNLASVDVLERLFDKGAEGQILRKLEKSELLKGASSNGLGVWISKLKSFGFNMSRSALGEALFEKAKLKLSKELEAKDRNLAALYIRHLPFGREELREIKKHKSGSREHSLLEWNYLMLKAERKKEGNLALYKRFEEEDFDRLEKLFDNIKEDYQDKYGSEWNKELLVYQPRVRLALAFYEYQKLCKQLGLGEISYKTGPSAVLGAKTVTLLNMTKAIEILTTGKKWKAKYAVGEDENSLIHSVLNREGEVVVTQIWNAKRLLSKSVVKDVKSIMQMIPLIGTAKSSQSMLPCEGQNAWYTGGKTGTADDYTNSIYGGFFDHKFEGSGQSVMSVYVGSDDNEKMLINLKKGRRAGVDGSRGALPIWSALVMNTIQESEGYQKPCKHSGADLDFKGSGLYRLNPYTGEKLSSGQTYRLPHL
jgi:penicillin-binding protein 1A